MGTLKTGPNYVPEQWIRHEGHPGWRFDQVMFDGTFDRMLDRFRWDLRSNARQIDGILNKSFATSAKQPDLITIHLGTNDCGVSSVD